MLEVSSGQLDMGVRRSGERLELGRWRNQNTGEMRVWVWEDGSADKALVIEA